MYRSQHELERTMSTDLKRSKKYSLLFYPLGLLIALVAHLLLCGACVCLAVAGHQIYWCSALGYALLLGLLIRNDAQRRSGRGRRPSHGEQRAPIHCGPRRRARKAAAAPTVTGARGAPGGDVGSDVAGPRISDAPTAAPPAPAGGS